VPDELSDEDDDEPPPVVEPDELPVLDPELAWPDPSPLVPVPVLVPVPELELELELADEPEFSVLEA
jgi:hypothetical protein